MGQSHLDPDARSSTVEAAWNEHRGRVLDIGYRMLGTVTDAEDVAQDVFSKLLAADRGEIDDILGWLVTVTTRVCVDRLRLHEHSRRAYVGPWLPEPVLDTSADSVGDRITLDESVRMAFLVVLDRLSPAERAAFILHDVFMLPFSEIGEIVGRTTDACRQLAARARRRIQSDQAIARLPVDRTNHTEIAERFAAACREGDINSLIEVLAPAAVGDFDSGGQIPGAPLAELEGAAMIAAQLVARVTPLRAEFAVRSINGDPGVVITKAGRILAAIALGIHDGRIDIVHSIGNPAKLRHLQPATPS